jgi:hypothetical protein
MTQVSAHEQRRLGARHEYRLLDAPADDELAAVAGVPTATLPLIDGNRQRDGGGTVVSGTRPVA